MAIIQLYPEKMKEAQTGARVPERFVGNIEMTLSTRFELVGGVWVAPQAQEEGQDLTNLIGIMQTHEKMRLMNKTTGHEIKI